MTRSPSAPRSAARFWIALLILAAFAAGGRPALAQAVKIIDVNAKLQITVADEADVSGPYTVDPDGNINMLYVNQVHVAGLTTAQAQAKLASKQYLGKFYKRPQVIVTILSPGGITVTLTGQVGAQKDYTVRSDAHLNDILSLAEPTVDADLAHVQVTSGLPGATKIKSEYDYLSYRNGNDPVGNPPLHDADLIYVPAKTPPPIEVNLLGDLGKTGKVPFPAGTTVLEAIQQEGGLTPTVDPKSFTLQHANDSTKVPFDYFKARENSADRQINPLLQDGDTLSSNSQATTTNSYTLIGGVRNPGKFPLITTNTTLADAIGSAGGLNPGARLRETKITRTGADGKVQTVALDANDQTVQASTKVYPGDNINIPQGRPGYSPSPTDILGAIGGVASVIFLFGRR